MVTKVQLAVQVSLVQKVPEVWMVHLDVTVLQDLKVTEDPQDFPDNKVFPVWLDHLVHLELPVNKDQMVKLVTLVFKVTQVLKVLVVQWDQLVNKELKVI